ncbi:MAG: alpha/beta fold hydrolase [Paracoccaceae bacterium]
MLATTAHGSPTARPPLIILHGLFGSARNWGAIARGLASDRLVVTPDMRNHGESFRAPSQSYREMAGDVAELAASLAPARPDVLGHSMGGKAAMVLALTRPDLVGRLIVADIAPVAYAHSHAGLIRAMQGLDLAGVTRRSEADRRLAATVPDPATRAFLLQSLDLASDPPRWRLNLPVLLGEMHRITGWPAVSGRFESPALFLSGERSDYVRPEHRDPILALFPQARFEVLAGAGHWLHADRPREFEAAVRAFRG